ncbi:MAG TPA: NAD-dependent epimerase/dehydratase family protein [Acidimicrobiales bacterium]|nr:NAD-dependent epimerase/dehydratase family protein [Acidimicrobiales bacterium]
MKVVVTGGAGFIGANLCRALSGDDRFDEVVALDDLSTGSAENLAGVEKVRLVTGSILDAGVLDETLAGSSAVVHLAARPSVARSLDNPEATHRVNSTGTLAVLDAARRGSRPYVVISSSSSVYGSNPTLPKSENLLPAPMSPYAASKLGAESYARAFSQSFGLDVLTFRFFNVFGPLQSPWHDYAAVVPSFLWAAMSAQPLRMFGDGLQSRDFTYVGSVVRVLEAALRRRVTHDGPVNLAFGTNVSLIELVSLIRELVGQDLTIEHLKSRPGDVRHSQADNSLLLHLFPEAEPVSLREALAVTADWLRSLRPAASP